MGPLSIRTRPSHLPGPALSKSGIPGRHEETDVFLIGIRASCSYAALDYLSRSLSLYTLEENGLFIRGLYGRRGSVPLERSCRNNRKLFAEIIKDCKYCSFSL